LYFDVIRYLTEDAQPSPQDMSGFPRNDQEKAFYLDVINHLTEDAQPLSQLFEPDASHGNKQEKHSEDGDNSDTLIVPQDDGNDG
jgi:hypothetical protein